jgi:hypothetical protein
MRRPPLTRRMTVAGVALAVLVGVLGGDPEAWAQAAGPDPCRAGQPCFTDVTDILNGRRHLLRKDDLAVAYQVGPLGDESVSLASRLLTDTSTITSNTPSSFGTNGNNSNPVVIGGRLFDTPDDVAVSAVLAAGLQWFIDGATGGIAEGALVHATGDPRLLAAAADFTGDGYDDLIFFAAADFSFGALGPAVVVATAVDPADPSQGLRFGGWFNFQHSVAGHANPLAIATGTIAGKLRVFTLGHTKDDDSFRCNFLNDLVIERYIVDPQSLAVTSEGMLFPLTIPEGDAACGQFAAMAVGRFGATLHDQLAVAYAVQGGGLGLAQASKSVSYKVGFAPNWSRVLLSSLSSTSSSVRRCWAAGSLDSGIPSIIRCRSALSVILYSLTLELWAKILSNLRSFQLHFYLARTIQYILL